MTFQQFGAIHGVRVFGGSAALALLLSISACDQAGPTEPASAQTALPTGGLASAQVGVTESGINSTAFGSHTTASGDHSTALGFRTVAEGDRSTAMGDRTEASNNGAVAMGNQTRATGANSTAMGRSTLASGDNAMAMGRETSATGPNTTTLGYRSTASGNHSIAMGAETTASGDYSLGMGVGSVATGASAVALGARSRADGKFSVAIGNLAEAVHTGSIVIGDNGGNAVRSTGVNQFVVKASGGTILYSDNSSNAGVRLAAGSGSWSSLSDATMKENYHEVDAEAVLEKLAAMRIQKWNYISQAAGIRHIGPTAQDFYAAFGLGESDTRINTIDADGIALVAIQALERRNSELRETVEAHEAELDRLNKRLEALEQAVSALQK